MVVTIVVLLVLTVAAIGGALWTNASKDLGSDGPIPPVESPPDLEVSLDGETATVRAGSASAPITVDIYEDYLCPACRELEQRYAQTIHEKLVSGAVQVRHHPVNLLDKRSDPPGYSLRAANAALAVAQLTPSRFVDYHHSLFAAQPEEGARAYSVDALVELGQQLGVPSGRLRANIESGVFFDSIQRSLETASDDPRLRQPGRGFGTPTVLVNGSVVDPWDSGWLAAA